MLRTLLLLCSVAATALAAGGDLAAAAATDGVNYTFLTSCNGIRPLYDATFATCFQPSGAPTLADTVIFPAGTNINIGTGVGYAPYFPLFADTIVIEAGAVVIFSNGMVAFQHQLHVYGRLVLNGSTGAGVGPWDDGFNRPPQLPRYQMPGFTPAVIGQLPTNLSVVKVFGLLEFSCGNDGYDCYPSIQVDLVVTLDGTVLVDQAAWIYGDIRNYGNFTAPGLYCNSFVNEPSGDLTLDVLYEGGLANYGHATINYVSSDKMAVAIANHGTLELHEAAAAAPHASARLGEFVFAQRVENTGTLVLTSRRVRTDRFLFRAELLNTGTVVLQDAGLTLTHAYTGAPGSAVVADSALGDWITFRGQTHFAAGSALNITGHGVTLHGACVNHGAVHYAGPRLNVLAGLHNAGTFDVHPTGSNVVAVDGTVVNTGALALRAHLTVDGDVVNDGTLTLGHASATLKQHLFNDGELLVTDAVPKRTRCFVEGHTYSTGNITVANAHLTVTSLVQHGASIHLATKAATVTLGSWGTSLQRGVARGYLRRAATDVAAVCGSSSSELASTTATTDDGAQAPTCFSCSECCPESDMCTSYFDSIYCGGYEVFPGPEQQQFQQQPRYALAAATLAKMPARMRHTLAHAAFQQAHVFAGDVRVAGPGALTTIDTVEVQGHLQIEEGAEVFSMVDHGKAVASGGAAGGGHITVHRCGKWYLGNDGRLAAGSPNITVAAGGAVVVPTHSVMALEQGHLHVRRGGVVHIDGAVTTGGRFALHAEVEGFQYGGRGKVHHATKD